MERRLILAVLLSFLTVSLYGMATGKCTPPPPPDPAENGGAPEAGPAGAEKGGKPGGDNPAGAGKAAPTGQAAAPVPPPQPVVSPEEAAEYAKRPAAAPVVRSPADSEFEVGFTSQGAAVEFIRLNNVFQEDNETPLDIVVPPARDLLLGQVDGTLLEPTYGAPGGLDRRDDPPGPLREFHWKLAEEDRHARPDDPTVVYTFETLDGGVWRKEWVLPSAKGHYDLVLRLSYEAPKVEPPENADDKPAEPEPVRLKILVASGLFREPPTGAAFQYPNINIIRMKGQEGIGEAGFGLPVPSSEVTPSLLALLGARTHYFLQTVYFGEGQSHAPSIVRWWATGTEVDRREEMKESVAAHLAAMGNATADPTDPAFDARLRAAVEGFRQAWLVIELKPGAENAVEIPFFVGPIERSVLAQETYAAVEPVIQYPPAFFAPDILAKALLAVYDFFRRLFGNAGIGVILMTLVVRGLMMPISIRNQLSMRGYSRKIAKLKPKLDVLKKKFGHNPKRMRDEQAKLYREHGVGFPTGCLMLFIQLPIFFALFAALRTEYTLRNASFLWIQDLSGPDKLIDFGHVVLDIGILTIFSINVLPLLMVGLSIWQQRLMPKPADEQQAQQMKMMKWLPIIFAVILYNYTAALSLYMVLSSAVSIVESRIVRRMDAAQGGLVPDAEWPGAKGEAPA